MTELLAHFSMLDPDPDECLECGCGKGVHTGDCPNALRNETAA